MASRILAFTSLTVVVAATSGKVNGPLTPFDGEITTRVKVNGLEVSAPFSGASGAVGRSAG